MILNSNDIFFVQSESEDHNSQITHERVKSNYNTNVSNGQKGETRGGPGTTQHNPCMSWDLDCTPCSMIYCGYMNSPNIYDLFLNILAAK